MTDRTRLRNRYRACLVFAVMWAARMFYDPEPMGLLRYMHAAAVAGFLFWGGYTWMEYRDKYPPKRLTK